MLPNAGLTVIESKRAHAPIGPLCHKHIAGDLETADFSEYAEFSIQNIMFIFGYLAGGLLKNGKLYTPDGEIVSTEEGKERMLQAVEEGIRKEGALAIGRYYLARRDEL